MFLLRFSMFQENNPGNRQIFSKMTGILKVHSDWYTCVKNVVQDMVKNSGRLDFCLSYLTPAMWSLSPSHFRLIWSRYNLYKSRRDLGKEKITHNLFYVWQEHVAVILLHIPLPFFWSPITPCVFCYMVMPPLCTMATSSRLSHQKIMYK